MDDSNIMVRIYPASGARLARTCIDMNTKHPGYMPPKIDVPEVPHSGLHDMLPNERESTVDAVSYNYLDHEPFIEVSFDHIPSTRHGLRLGRDEGNDIVLLGVEISGFHLALTFDDNYCLVVHDLGSRNGTEVMYEGISSGGFRSNFHWIVSGHRFISEKVTGIIVAPSEMVQLRLEIPEHNVGDESYRYKVDRFRRGTESTSIPGLDGIGLNRVETRVQTGVHTPIDTAADVTLIDEVGEGTFGKVYRVMSVITGKEYALKKPIPSKRIHEQMWERESVILERIDHVRSNQSSLSWPYSLTYI